MASNDSSVWRSIAVAFGDGLAFGVGMKLTQNASRQVLPTAAAPNTETRLAEMESRLRNLERAPARAVFAGFDRQVLEAVVNAIEERFNETSARVERRISEMEAKMAREVAAIQQRVKALSPAPRAAMDELRTGLSHALDAVEQRGTDRAAALDGKLAELQSVLPEAIRLEVEARIAAFEWKLQHEIRAATDRAAELARRAVDAHFDARLATVQECAERQDRAIEEMRLRSAQSDRTVLDLLSGIGRLCDEAARRIELAPPPEAVAAESPAVADETAAEPGAEEDASGAPVPLFAQPKKPANLWRIPMVSSFVISAIGLALLRLL